MTARTALTIGALLLLLTGLGSALRVFDARQQALTLEGNRLLSAASVTAKGNAHSILAAADGVTGGVRVLTQVSPDGRVRAVLAQDGADLSFPLHAGRTFAPGEHGTALVGSAVALVERDGTRYFALGDREYEVVGYLGLRADSLVAGDVLLNDPGLFAADESEDLVIDGPGIDSAVVESFGGRDVATMRTGTHRRTNVDVVSPVVLALGTVVVGLGLAFCGGLTNALLRRHTHVRHVLGFTRGRLFVSALVPLLALWAVATAVPATFWRMHPDAMVSWAIVLPVGLVWQTAVLVGSFTVAFVATRGKA